jgi:hypothetical protein
VCSTGWAIPGLCWTPVSDRAWIEDRRAIESFFLQEVDRDKIVLFGRP